MSQDTLVEVKHLKEYFNINTGLFSSKPLKAVDDVSFAIHRGETLGLVGESGCGKTTVGRTLLHLYKPTDGEIWFDGKQIVTKKDIAEYRQKTAMVFQDPYSSLNPRMTVEEIIGEGLDAEPGHFCDVGVRAAGGVVGQKQVSPAAFPHVPQKILRAVKERFAQVDRAVHIQQEQPFFRKGHQVPPVIKIPYHYTVFPAI